MFQTLKDHLQEVLLFRMYLIYYLNLTEAALLFINPYPANVDKMVS